VRADYRRERKVEFREDYFDIMPGAEIDKQIDQLLGDSAQKHTVPRSRLLLGDFSEERARIL